MVGVRSGRADGGAEEEVEEGPGSRLDGVEGWKKGWRLEGVDEWKRGSRLVEEGVEGWKRGWKKRDQCSRVCVITIRVINLVITIIRVIRVANLVG